ncbi:SMI1/KNR4 family protein [Bacillus haynesii]|uniref:SMI1/KNR4 family protein n=1 Tax=Bacillus haynesii TaxID=1925021 RepID=UPI00227FC4C4|nr:SMI1/KNR4 family protein [Bacillus haynesii]MCY8343151.1 SMI1/KNR4 family protein [Bacillus haynesii]MCY9151132.1 SMI1/KNR4 family protein [Bacillus haynesii]
MHLTSFVQNTVNGLNSLLDQNGVIKILGSEGEITDTLVTFSDRGASQSDIRAFESHHQLSLPADYKKFLTLHNGARIFDILLDGVNIGGGLHLFNLNEIDTELKDEELYEDVSGIPVGHLLEECDLIIDRERLKEGDPNYLYLLEDGLEYKPLDLNFEIFLDRYVLCHGQPFWEWRYYTVENYYRT